MADVPAPRMSDLHAPFPPSHQRVIIPNYQNRFQEENEDVDKFIPGLDVGQDFDGFEPKYNDQDVNVGQDLDVHGDFDNLHDIWTLAADWVKSREIIPAIAPDLGTVLYAMANSKITKADVGYKGTQLKLLLSLENDQIVVFKPMRYSRDHVINGNPYAGYDRHNSEIAGFHLDRILGFRRAPLVVGRHVDLKKEIIPVASDRLLQTFFKGVGNSTCFYGSCHYCNKEEPACDDGVFLEGSITLWLPSSWPLQKHRHPWGRTYKAGKKAKWEYDNTYCREIIVKDPFNSGPRLLDIMDTCIFDYLIGNGDRHHYETFQQDGADGMLLNMDNAKGFGNPFHDEKSILAPLYQCCKIRRATYQKLLTLSDGKLSEFMKQALSHDPVSPVLVPLHYEAMDRRLRAVLSEIQKCISRNGESHVMVDGLVL
uniref:Glycosaminoglycan xylosylkinase-like n=1 Tax=Saccoglossus kowalevskii TaxID=10224 RepID=A0ABM0MRD7_SACKO|nr:PREDICTED: glycosaminoglycan xylosylkinase-like [Saccoglossus kowalevskii]